MFYYCGKGGRKRLRVVWLMQVCRQSASQKSNACAACTLSEHATSGLTIHLIPYGRWGLVCSHGTCIYRHRCRLNS
jgi:hypothetical protein